MANNNKHTGPNVPALRFPEFSGEWERKALSEFVDRVTRRNKGLKSTRPLTISAQYGLVDQTEFFKKSVAGADLSNYYLLSKGEFAYNKSYSDGYPLGAIKRLDRYDSGVLSSLYICFVPKPYMSSDYLVQYFESTKWNQVVKDISGEGARNHGLLNVPVTGFFETQHYIPKRDEQEKLGAFLTLIEKRIATQSKIIEELTALRSALHQEIMSKGLKDGSWRMQTLADVLSERTELNNDGHAVHSVSVSKGIVNQIEYLGRSFAAKDTSRYHVACPGDVVYTKSPTGEFPYGIVKQSQISIKAALSPLYGVYVPISPEIGYIIHNHFLSAKNALNYLHPLIQKGAKNTINITNQRFLKNSMPLPSSNSVARLYYKTIKTLSDKIDLEVSILDQLQIQKRKLLNNMFI